MQAAWIGTELIDARGSVLAAVQSDVLIAADTSMLVERTLGRGRFRARGTTATGSVGIVWQEGLTVQVLQADCTEQHFELRRRSPWRKDRVITAGEHEIATVRPMVSGKVVVEWEESAVGLVAMAFLTWACVLVDSPVRQPRI